MSPAKRDLIVRYAAGAQRSPVTISPYHGTASIAIDSIGASHIRLNKIDRRGGPMHYGRNHSAHRMHNG
jgi:hypothetical protein